jgi:hypothetical protein
MVELYHGQPSYLHFRTFDDFGPQAFQELPHGSFTSFEEIREVSGRVAEARYMAESNWSGNMDGDWKVVPNPAAGPPSNQEAQMRRAIRLWEEKMDMSLAYLHKKQAEHEAFNPADRKSKYWRELQAAYQAWETALRTYPG